MSPPQLFFVLGLPRSRTAWMANFLTQGQVFCYHEPTRLVGSMRELRELLECTQGCTHVGASDPSLAYVAHEWRREFPGVPAIELRRDPTAVAHSLKAWLGDQVDTALILKKGLAGLTSLGLPKFHATAMGYDEELTRRAWDKLGLPPREFSPLRCGELATLNVQVGPSRYRDASAASARWLKEALGVVA